MIKLSKRIVFLLFLFAAGSATAEITYGSCRDFNNVPVASVSNYSVPDIAVATYAQNGAPIIVYNPNILSWVSPATRLFFYAHECAHHALGHLAQSIPSTREQAADCWGLRALVFLKLLNDNDISIIQQDIGRFGVGDWTHIPGRQRAINLRACLGNSGAGGGKASQFEDSCEDKCWMKDDKCILACPDDDGWKACSNRCKGRFDSCVSRCE